MQKNIKLTDMPIPKFEYMQLDLTQRERMLDMLKTAQHEEYLIVGVEVTDVQCGNTCHINVDPQHGFATNNDITSVELMYRYIDKLKAMFPMFENILFVTVKPDVDSISAMVLASMYLSDPGFSLNDGDMMLRLITIANSDRHGDNEPWDKHKRINYFNERNLYSRHGLPIGLLAAMGDIRESILNKVSWMFSYLNTGTFDKIDKYTSMVLRKNEVNSKSTDIDIVIDGKLVFIESNYRGALGLGYRYAPVVIAKNPSYVFSNNISGPKYTIAQFNNGHIDLEKIMNTLNEKEPGWGGDVKSILGSPQDRPSKLTSKDVCDIVQNEV